MAAAVLSAMLMGITFEEAKCIINQTRNVSFDKPERKMQRAWMDSVIREGVTDALVPTGFSEARMFRVLWAEDAAIQATAMVNGSPEPICHWKGVVDEQDFKSNTIIVDSVEQASRQFYGRFCVNCEPLLRASLRVNVDQFYGEAEC